MHLTKAKKVIAGFCALSLAFTAAPFTDGSPISLLAAAASSESGTGITYDFRDGSIIPTDTDGKSDVTKGDITIKVGTKNAYAYNSAQHGVQFKAGNSIEIKVDGPTKLTVGDCEYSNATELTVKSADGSYSETKSLKAGCYHNDGSAAVFKYTGEAAATLVIEFTAGTYVPVIIAEPIDNTPDQNGVPKDSVYMYNFSDGSIVPDETIGQVVEKTVTSKDGFLTVNSNGNVAFSSNQHGVLVSNGASFDIKVAGDSYITFDLCSNSVDSGATVTASSPKGDFVGETTLPLVNGDIDGGSATFEYKGVATTLTFTVKTGSTVNIHNINVTNKPDPTDPPKAAGNGKIDAWDFGAEQLDTTKYNNLLDVATINSFYAAGTEAGAEGKNILSFNTGDLLFSAGGRTNNRLRTSNTALTRYDSRTKTIDGVDLTGMLYSNTSSSAGVFLGVKLYANDVLTLYMTSNGGASTIYCESPSGKIQEGQSSGDGAKLTFYASEYGMYKIYSINEKLTVWRALREHTNPVKVSGKVDTSAASAIDSKDYKLCFTNTSTGEAKEAEVINGSYSIYLNDQYTYNVSLVDANGFIIKDNKALTLEKGAAATTRDISIISVDLVTVTGKITGLSEDALAKLKLSFVNDKQAYVPEFTVSGDSITMLLEKGVTYDVIAENVNDYEVTAKTISKTADGTQDIAFSAKPTYGINVKYDGLPSAAQSSAVLTFTNINEDGYVYTFKAGETPKLRDGSYTVKVTGTGSAAYAQKLTSNVNVNGKAVDKTISFEAIETWDFAQYANSLETIDGKNFYLGLELSDSGVSVNQNKYLLVKGGEVKFNVKKGQLITLEYCYEAAFDINGDRVISRSGSTSKMETTTFVAPEDTQVLIKGIEGKTEDGKDAVQTYFTKISVATPAAYKAQVTVGKDKDYQTINDALEAVAKMDRPNNERVEIVIDPGNYEEMLDINTPNVTLKNAAGDKSSLSIINKGVDIGENVVRITSYYGHGYNYYSMGNGTQWDADVLAANKENGYISHENAGSGKNNESYWNATVVVYAPGFEADGIVFENSFNQYISKKESEDIVVKWEIGAPSGGVRPTTYGDTSVQSRSFVERAAALALAGNADKAVFNNCKFIGRQDTLYGEQNIKVAFNKCDILGAVDYIFGGMNAVFYQCKLRMNTDDKASSDEAYLTAAQQSAGRGYLMYNCTVTSTTPGVDTASEYLSKPGYFGRPWQANTSEVVFYNTIVETTDFPGSEGKSLIKPEAWRNSLGGESPLMYEYGTEEKSGEDNSSKRASWSTRLETPYIDDGKTEITVKAFLGDWTDELNERGLLIEETEKAPIEFEDSGIKVTAPEGAFENPDDITFNADPIEKETNDKQSAFDLSFTGKDGNKVQPAVSVTVRMPVPEKLAGKTIYVYHVDGDNKYTEIEFKIEDGMAVFTASEFSKYIITSEKYSAPTESDPSDPGTNDPNTPNPPTGVGAGVAIALAVAAGSVIIVCKKKRK